MGPLVEAGSAWALLCGTEAPPSNWTAPEFDNSAWAVVPAPVGYDSEVTLETPLSDMRGQYTQFFLRKRIEVPQPEWFQALRIEALYDDGFKLWINGILLSNPAMPAGDLPWNGVTNGGARRTTATRPSRSRFPGASCTRGRMSSQSRSPT